LKNVTVKGRFYAHVFGADLPAAVWKATMSGALRGVPARNFAGAGAHVAADAMSGVNGGGRHGSPGPAPPPPAAHQRPPKRHGHH
jgi:ABC-type sugar transport system substrate-binding protein